MNAKKEKEKKRKFRQSRTTSLTATKSEVVKGHSVSVIKQWELKEKLDQN